MISRRFLMFLVSGGVAAAANILSRVLFGLWVPYWASIVLAYLVGLATAFVLMRTLAFTTSRNATHAQAMWFVLVNLVGLLQTFIISLVLAHWLFPMMGFERGAATVAHAIGVIVPVLTSYLGHKHLSFRH